MDDFIANAFLSLAGKISTDHGCANFSQSLFFIPYGKPDVKHRRDLFRQCGLHRKGDRYVRTRLQEPRDPQSKGPLLQPPSPIRPLARLHARNSQLPGKNSEPHLALQISGAGIFYATGKYNCGPIPRPWEIPESLG